MCPSGTHMHPPWYIQHAMSKVQLPESMLGSWMRQCEIIVNQSACLCFCHVDNQDILIRKVLFGYHPNVAFSGFFIWEIVFKDDTLHVGRKFFTV